MASMWKRAMTYLGLGDDEDFVEYDDEPAPEPRRAPERRPVGGPQREQREPEVRRPAPPDEPPDVVLRGGGTVRPMPPQTRQVQSGVGAVTARNPAGTAGRPGGPGRGAVVRPLPIPVTAKPHVVVPRSFNEAQEVADLIKGSAPVIMNLQEADRDLSRRLIDFASGLCYGLGGSMERVANSVYLLTPTDVEVSAEDKRRLEERGYSS
jgi:cell division inhibitor SepF